MLENEEYILRQLVKNQKYDQVVDVCVEYLMRYRRDHVSWYFLGLIYEKRGELRKAKQAFKLHERYWKLWQKENEAQW